uniref:Uncharacterized protein n=1 Tax=Arundo donax TaxID=35708 RepID=A0A0A9CVN9_ARUDO
MRKPHFPLVAPSLTQYRLHFLLLQMSSILYVSLSHSSHASRERERTLIFWPYNYRNLGWSKMTRSCLSLSAAHEPGHKSGFLPAEKSLNNTWGT